MLGGARRLAGPIFWKPLLVPGPTDFPVFGLISGQKRILMDFSMDLGRFLAWRLFWVNFVFSEQLSGQKAEVGQMLLHFRAYPCHTACCVSLVGLIALQIGILAAMAKRHKSVHGASGFGADEDAADLRKGASSLAGLFNWPDELAEDRQVASMMLGLTLFALSFVCSAPILLAVAVAVSLVQTVADSCSVSVAEHVVPVAC